MKDFCRRCGEPITNDQATTGRLTGGPHHILCPPTTTDGTGVDFSPNCCTLQLCRRDNLCLGHCKLY